MMFWSRRSIPVNLAGLLLFITAAIGVIYIEVLLTRTSSSSQWWPPTIYSGILLATALVVRLFDRRTLAWVGLGLHRHMPREILLGFGMGGIMALIAWLPSALVGEVSYQQTPVGQLLPGLLFVLIMATGEEIAFRGYLYQRVVEILGPTVGTLLFSALFTIGHLGNPEITILGGINIFLAGILFSLCWFVTGSLWTSIALHSTWNLMLGPVLGIQVSGLYFSEAMFRTTPAGSPFLTGAEFGPEGGIITTAVLVGGGIFLAKSSWFTYSPYIFARVFRNHYRLGKSRKRAS